MSNQTLIGRYRWTICALLFFACTINYMDRQILGLLKPSLSQTFNWSEQDYGNIVVAFQAAYATGQVLFGPFIEWIGMKSAYAFAMVFWSIAAMAHPLARSAFGFGAARFALGLGESGNFPAAIRTVAEWFPQRERSVATGLFNSGTNIGAIFAPLLVPWLTLQFGWKGAFIILGITGFLWLIFWFVFYDSPEKSRRLKADELAYIQGGRAEPAEKVPWRKILVFKETWAYIATGIFVGPVWWFYLFWLPDFFSKQFHLDLKSFGLPLVAVYSVTCLGSIGGGGLSAWFLRRGWSLNSARKTAALICACCTVPVIFATRTQYVWLATSFFALAAAAHQGWSATMYTVVSDIFPKKAVASVVGLAGTFASVAAMGFSWLVGYILQGTGVYDKILLICGLAYLLALGIFHTIVPKIQPVEMV
jgi:ACS family hexuronate transporter-like MFS transporter